MFTDRWVPCHLLNQTNSTFTPQQSPVLTSVDLKSQLDHIQLLYCTNGFFVRAKLRSRVEFKVLKVIAIAVTRTIRIEVLKHSHCGVGEQHLCNSLAKKNQQKNPETPGY